MTIDELMRTAPVIPILVLGDDGADPVALAETLVEAGLPVIEVTLRSPGALAVVERMARVPGAIVGAGTVVDPDQLARAIDVGARFIVSPGLTQKLGRAAIDSGVPYLPGVASAGDIMRGMELGLNRFKFFPAVAAGALKALKSLSEPLFDARFCPTGGVTKDSAPEWLAHPSVLCVGGTWIVPAGVRDLGVIAASARAAAAISRDRTDVVSS